MASPMYRQIAEDVREQITSGKLKPGQQIPTEIELRRRYDASRNTVRDAIKWLMSLGMVETRPGQGTFVVKKIVPFVTALTTADPGGPGDDSIVVPAARYGEVEESEPGEREFTSSEPQVEIQKASTSVASQLRIAEGSQVISRHQKRYIDGTPWSMQTSFYPMGFALNGADLLLRAENIEVGTVRYLTESLGLQQSGYRDWIAVRSPDAPEAAFFSLPPDGRTSVFEIFRTAFDQTKRPIRLTITVFPADRNQFIVNVGDVPSEET